MRRAFGIAHGRLALMIAVVALVLALAPRADALVSLLGIKNQMVEFLLEQLSTEGEFEITAETVEEPSDGVTAITGLKIADGDGVWLMVDSLNFAWNPSRLLRGEVEFSNLAAVGIQVLRAPAVPEGEEAEALDAATPTVEAGAFQWPRSPLTLRIDRMALERVQIAEAALGHAIAFDAEGAARDEGDVQAASLNLTRTDGVAGTIRFDYARNFTDNTLKIALEAEEAPGGLVAALADLPQDAASTLRLTADGPPTDWRAAFDLRLAELVTAAGTAAISYEGPVNVLADLSARPGPRMAPKFAALIGAEARLEAEASEGADGTILIRRGRLTSPHARIEASGSYSRPTGAADLALRMEADRGLTQPFDGVDLGGARFEGTVKGAPGTFAAEGRLGLSDLATAPVDVAEADLALVLGQSGPEDAVTTTVSVEGQTKGLRLDKIAAEVIGAAETVLAATLTGNDLVLETARIDSRVLQVSAAGAVDLATENAEISFAAASPAIAPVAAAYGVAATGEIDISGKAVREGGVTDLDIEADLARFSHPVADARALSLTGTVRDAPEKLAFAITGAGEALRLDRIGPDLLDRADLAINGALEGDALNLSQLVLETPVLKAVLRGDYALGTGAADLGYRIDTPDVSRVAGLYDVPLFGRFAASGRAVLAGPDAPPQLAGEVNAFGLGFDGTRYGDVDLTHDVALSDAPEGTLDARFQNSPYGAGRVRTGFAFAQPLLELTGVNAQALGVDAKGALTVDLGRTLATGALDIARADLAALRPLTGTAVNGRARGKVRLTAPGGRQNAALDLTVAGLEADGLRTENAAVKATLADVTGTPRIDGTVTLRGVQADPLALDRASLTAKGPLSRLQISAEAAGQAEGEPVTLSAAAAVDAASAILRANVTRLDAALGEQAIRLNRPASIAVNGATISARNLDVALPGQGLLAGDVTYYGGPMAGDIRLQMPDLAILKQIADAPVRAGSLDAALTFDTRRSRASADGLVAGRGLIFEDVDVAGALDMDATLAWQGRRATLGATVSGDFGDPLRLSADVPMRAGGALPELAGRGPVEGRLDWTGRIDSLWALVPAPGHVLTGEAVIDLGISGDIADPTFTGGARISDGGYQNLDLGTILTDLALETSINAGDLGLTLTASDGAKGTVKTEGRFALDASGVDLTTTIDRAVLVRRDDATARLNGAVKVAGPLTGLAVTGDVTVEEAEIRLVNANPPSIVVLEEVIFKGDPPKPDAANEGTTTLDLAVNAPARMFVRGRGLDSEWQMGLKVAGKAASPRISGRIERVRGRLDLIGKGFDLARGRIDFDGGAKIDPRIDIQLERRTSNLTGRIIVEGTASDPELRFASTPALPEDEVLPRVLFGKSSQALTGSQAIQLGVGLATLMDGGAGTLDTARSAAGLDQLRIEQDEQGNASVAIGREVAEGIWVGSKQPLGEGGTSVVVEIDVFEEVTIDTEVEQGGGASIGIQWKRDF